MKKVVLNLIMLTVAMNFLGCNNSADPSKWSDEKIDAWYDKGEWLNGWTISPDASISRKELALAYFRHPERWDKAFKFLKESDLLALEVKRYDIDGDNLFATISEYTTKNEEDASFEAHRKYIDIQYMISGTEKMSVAPLSTTKDVLTPYDEVKDIIFMTVSKSSDRIATPGKFYIFFPFDAHRPSVRVSENSSVRKVVIKVRIE